MPFKARQFYSRRDKTSKTQQPKRNWSDYNKKMKMRGNITIWLSPANVFVTVKKWIIMSQWAQSHINKDRILSITDVNHAASERIMQKAGMIFSKRDKVEDMDCVIYEYKL